MQPPERKAMRTLFCFFVITISMYGSCITPEINGQISGTWRIVDLDFGKNANPLLVAGAIATDKPAFIAFQNQRLKVLDAANHVLEEKQYKIQGDTLILLGVDGESDLAVMHFTKGEKLLLTFQNDRKLFLEKQKQANF